MVAPCLWGAQTFTSLKGFRAHMKSLQRAGEVSPSAATGATPVEVRVLDSYLTVNASAGTGGEAGGGTAQGEGIAYGSTSYPVSRVVG